MIETQPLTEKTIYRAALGQNKTLGALYDARTDQFVPGLLFRNPYTFIIYAPFLSEASSFEESQLDRFEKTNISSEQKLSILFGDIPVEGSGKYFTVTSNDTTSVTATLKYIVQTKIEECDPLSSERNNSLLSSGATHVVTRITWGVCTYASIQLATSTDQMSKKAAQYKLQNLLQRIFLETRRETQEQLDPLHQFEMKLFSDVLLPGKTPTTVDDLPKFLRQIPEFINNVNQGNGVPIEYELFPLRAFYSQQIPLKKMEETGFLQYMEQSRDQFDLVKSIETLFKLVERAKSDFYAFQKECDKLKEILPSKLVQEMEDKTLKMQNLETKFKKEVMLGIWTIRKEGQTRKLQRTLDTIWDLFNVSNPKNFLETWRFMKERLEIFLFFKNKGVILQKTPLSYQNILLEYSFEKTFVFFYCEDDKDQLQKNVAWFKVLVEEQSKRHRMILIDLEALENQETHERKSFIHYYKKGILICKDYASTNFILWDDKMKKIETFKSFNVKPFIIACPNSVQRKCVENVQQAWVCENCQQAIDIDEESYLSCDCFRYPLNKARFKCSDPRHGSEFVDFDNRSIEAISLPSREIQYLMGPGVYQKDFPMYYFDEEQSLASDIKSHIFMECRHTEDLFYYDEPKPPLLKDWYGGKLKNGKREGKGTQLWVNGNRYVGDWRNDQRDGFGRQEWANQNEYEGDWEEDQRTGWGTFTWANGDVYTGDWKENKKTGGGKFVCTSGENYDGDWKNDKHEGRGTQVWANGDRYKGDWKNNQRHGEGKQEWANGDIYEGEWEDDQRVGKGKLTKANGEVYEWN